MAMATSAASATDIYFVVFCRLAGVDGYSIIEMPLDVLAPAVGALEQLIADVIKPAERKLSSPHGRILVVPADPERAVDLAATLVEQGAQRGLRLALSITMGPIDDVIDIAGPNLTGAVINSAARLASLNEVDGARLQRLGECRVAVEEDVYEQLRMQTRRYPDGRFSESKQGKAKRAQLSFRWLVQDSPTLGALPETEGALEGAVMHVLVYDIVSFSKLPDDRLPRIVEDLRREAQSALESAGFASDASLVPTGDGAVLVARKARPIWTVAKVLFAHCQGANLPIRIGLTTGPIALLDGVPLGSGVFQADGLSSLAEVDAICVAQSFWNRQLHEADRDGWIEVAAIEASNAVLVSPTNHARKRVHRSTRDISDVRTNVGHLLSASDIAATLLRQALGLGSGDQTELSRNLLDLPLDDFIETLHAVSAKALDGASKADDGKIKSRYQEAARVIHAIFVQTIPRRFGEELRRQGKFDESRFGVGLVQLPAAIETVAELIMAEFEDRGADFALPKGDEHYLKGTLCRSYWPELGPDATADDIVSAVSKNLIGKLVDANIQKRFKSQTLALAGVAARMLAGTQKKNRTHYMIIDMPNIPAEREIYEQAVEILAKNYPALIIIELSLDPELLLTQTELFYPVKDIVTAATDQPK